MSTNNVLKSNRLFEIKKNRAPSIFLKSALYYINIWFSWAYSDGNTYDNNISYYSVCGYCG